MGDVAPERMLGASKLSGTYLLRRYLGMFGSTPTWHAVDDAFQTRSSSVSRHFRVPGGLSSDRSISSPRATVSIEALWVTPCRPRRLHVHKVPLPCALRLRLVSMHSICIYIAV